MSSTAPNKRIASPAPPALGTDIRVSELKLRGIVQFVENDYRYPDAWGKIDDQHACELRDWE